MVPGKNIIRDERADRARERCFRRGPSERVRPCRGRDVHDRTAPIV